MSQMPDPASSEYLCPECGRAVGAVDQSRNIATCPHCGRDFFIGTADEELAPARVEQQSEPSAASENEFDQLRIRQTVVLRRGVYRSRSYAVVAALACAGAAAQCAYLAWRQIQTTGFNLRAVLFVILLFAGILGTIWFAARAGKLHREAKRSILPEPATPPDFSTLSDGSQRARDLEQIR